MLKEIKIPPLPALDDYANVAQLTHKVQELRSEAAMLAPKLRGRRIWMINSTEQGGGVAEMLPRLVSMLCEVGVDTRWAVMSTARQEFFGLTKHIHNLIHGSGEPCIEEAQRALYDRVSEEVAASLRPQLSPEDILVVHDPQPAGMGALLKRQLGLRCIWRCHIGLDRQLKQTEVAWEFLKPYVTAYDHTVFTAPEYIPSYLSGSVSIICPAVDPFSHKNRDLSTHKLVGILVNASLAAEHHPVVSPPFESPAMRLQPSGDFVRATTPEDLGLLYRPIVTQVSRWDDLKGWEPLLDGFVTLKRQTPRNDLDDRARRTLLYVRLVLAGPEPSAVADDPEAVGVLKRLIARYQTLPADIQNDIALLSLPMGSRKQNALMVNALQRCSSVVAQNSLREGFGLTVTEGMWKRVAVLGSAACGIRQQIRHGVDGYLNDAPDDPEAIATALRQLLVHPYERAQYAAHAQRRVNDEFLVFVQVAKWLRVLSAAAEPRHLSHAPHSS